MKHLSTLLGIALLMGLLSCQTNSQNPATNKTNTNISNNLVADTIIYDVIIRNINPYDKWAAKSLRGLQHAVLVDSLFSLVYDEQALAYDYFSGKEIKTRKIKSLEQEDWFSRDQIGKLQFAEKWYFSKAGMELRKEVISVALGHELYGDSGEFRGYKPIFKLYLQP